MMNENINIADIGTIFELFDGGYIENEFIMIDNIRSSSVQNSIDKIFPNYPIKVTYTIVFFCIGGSFSLKINLNEYIINQNDVLSILPGSIVEFSNAAVFTKIAMIAFSNKYFSPFDNMEDFMNIGRMLYKNPLLHSTDERMQECIDIYVKMKKKLKEVSNPFRKFVLKAYSNVLCSIALERFISNPAEKMSTNDRPMSLYNRFIELVQRDFRRHRTIQYYAEALNISPKYFSTLIKKVSGKSAGKWIDEYVLLEAKALLKSRRYTVQQISGLLSFPNQSFFAKYFKAHTGYTPTQYQTSAD